MNNAPLSFPYFDLIIVGGGHAGCEAAMAAARMGLQTLLVSSNLDKIGHLSCNPAIGGLGKGHIVKEIDALGGYMAKWADAAAIQVRILNESKGPAVRATRVQLDRNAYMNAVKKDIFSEPHLTPLEDMVCDVLIENNQVLGVRTLHNGEIRSKTVLICAGTFLAGLLHMGTSSRQGGRSGDVASNDLSSNLKKYNFSLRRFMTCTTPRLLTRSIDFSRLERQDGLEKIHNFSYHSSQEKLKQVPCYLTWTNATTHKIIVDSLSQSPMYNGTIPGPGPRYCPSIEDKIARFPDKSRHQIFIEPEGLESAESFPNGLPTGFPLEVQQAIVRSIAGLEQAVIVRPGYAVEYDVIDTQQLNLSLESKQISNLWFAGQINGTSGYEEAAGQGLWAAYNIFAKLHKKNVFTPKRSEAYLSVLIDDLVNKGTDEPYRMLTSRAEHRLLLRESNAVSRLYHYGKDFDVLGKEQCAYYEEQLEQLTALIHYLQKTRISPTANIQEFLQSIGESPLHNPCSLAELLRRPKLSIHSLTPFFSDLRGYSEELLNEAEISCKYDGYINQQKEIAKRQKNLDEIVLPTTISYEDVAGLSLEAQQKLQTLRPTTLGQASRVPGITPSALTCIEIHLRKFFKDFLK